MDIRYEDWIGECQECSTFTEAVSVRHTYCAEKYYPNDGIVDRDDVYHIMAHAVRKYKLFSLEFFLSKGADPNYFPNFKHCNPLIHIAFSYNNIIIVRKLINWGAQINILDHDGRCILHNVWSPYYHADQELIKFLMDNEADPNIVDKFGNTPLHYTAHIHRISSFADYMRKTRNNKINVSINQKNNEGDTALHLLIKHINEFPLPFPSITRKDFMRLNIVKYLLLAGADIYSINKEDHTPKTLAKGAVLDLILLVEKIEICNEMWIWYGFWENRIQWLPNEILEDVIELCMEYDLEC